MRNVISFRGVGMQINRKLLVSFIKDNQLDKWPLEEQLSLAIAFFEEEMAEDKLTGVLYLENYLMNKIHWSDQLARFQEIFDKRWIFDWNVCDWFCVKVLGPIIRENGYQAAEVLANWSEADYLWQARCSIVPFVKVADKPEFYPLLIQACIKLIQREERFSKTAVGWVLHDVSKTDPGFVISFVEQYLVYFSNESLKNALKYFNKPRQQFYLTEKRKLGKG